ncbi:MAG: M23 family metallopeptidase [Gammaproteobacteria bacterium]|nr:M23 family metallopeptidase [Gammaproteobacteria bacterium]
MPKIYPHYLIVLVFSLLVGACSDKGSTDTVCSDTNYPAAETSKFLLPFPVGKSYKLRQSNCGSITHTGALTYAYDFFMDVGETVTATRAGVVIFVKEDYPDGPGPNEQANFLVIKHDDNTISRYRHLKNNGVLVEVDDVVSAGQEIALSGNSGVPAGIANLHFDVMGPNSDGSYNQTIPVTFKNADPPAPTKTGLDEGVTYTALAY